MNTQAMYALSLDQIANAIATVGHQRTILVQGHMGNGKSSLLKTLASRFPDHVPCYFDCTTKDLGDTVVLTMAIVEPMIRAAGIDVIWFGIFLVVVIETAQVTPPIGFNLFVLQGMTKHEIGYIAKTAIPMVGLMLLMVVILVIFPELATWLPENIRSRN